MQARSRTTLKRTPIKACVNGDEDTLYQIVNLLVDTCATNRKLLHIAGDDKPAEVVRSRFMKLNADHIRFVLKCLAENSSPIRNMKQYLLASLYNAPTTMQLSYKQNLLKRFHQNVTIILYCMRITQKQLPTTRNK